MKKEHERTAPETANSLAIGLTNLLRNSFYNTSGPKIIDGTCQINFIQNIQLKSEFPKYFMALEFSKKTLKPIVKSFKIEYEVRKPISNQDVEKINIEIKRLISALGRAENSNARDLLMLALEDYLRLERAQKLRTKQLAFDVAPNRISQKIKDKKLRGHARRNFDRKRKFMEESEKYLIEN